MKMLLILIRKWIVCEEGKSKKPEEKAVLAAFGK